MLWLNATFDSVRSGIGLPPAKIRLNASKTFLTHSDGDDWALVAEIFVLVGGRPGFAKTVWVANSVMPPRARAA